MGNDRAVTVEIEKLSVGDFDNGLADNIIIRPGETPIVSDRFRASQSSLARPSD